MKPVLAEQAVRELLDSELRMLEAVGFFQCSRRLECGASQPAVFSGEQWLHVNPI